MTTRQRTRSMSSGSGVSLIRSSSEISLVKTSPSSSLVRSNYKTDGVRNAEEKTDFSPSDDNRQSESSGDRGGEESSLVHDTSASNEKQEIASATQAKLRKFQKKSFKPKYGVFTRKRLLKFGSSTFGCSVIHYNAVPVQECFGNNGQKAVLPAGWFRVLQWPSFKKTGVTRTYGVNVIYFNPSRSITIIQSQLRKCILLHPDLENYSFHWKRFFIQHNRLREFITRKSAKKIMRMLKRDGRQANETLEYHSQSSPSWTFVSSRPSEYTAATKASKSTLAQNSSVGHTLDESKTLPSELGSPSLSAKVSPNRDVFAASGAESEYEKVKVHDIKLSKTCQVVISYKEKCMANQKLYPSSSETHYASDGGLETANIGKETERPRVLTLGIRNRRYNTARLSLKKKSTPACSLDEKLSPKDSASLSKSGEDLVRGAESSHQCKAAQGIRKPGLTRNRF